MPPLARLDRRAGQGPRDLFLCQEAGEDESGQLPSVLIIDRKGADAALRESSPLALGEPPAPDQRARLTFRK
ncbi:MAG: hypothetical protein ACODAJ_09885 [Planctomycetota bacterium]